MKIRIALTVLVATSLSANAQVVVSLDIGEAAHACYLAAKDRLAPRDGIATCNAALNGENLSGGNRAATLDNRGVLYDAVGDSSAALDDFDASIRFNPQLGDPYLNRGVTLIRLKRTPEALDDIRKGVELGISLPQVGYYDLAVAEEDSGLIGQAYQDYKRALVADPDYAPASTALTRFTVVTRPAPQAP